MGKRAARSEVTEASAEASSGRRRWFIGAVLLAAGGIVGSSFAATSVARRDADKSQETFEHTAAQVASALQLALHAEESLVVHMKAFMRQYPEASNAQFADWLASVEALKRYPELDRAGLAVVVRAADLPEYSSRAVRDPAGPLGEDGTFQVIPPGDRPFYCFIVFASGRTPSVVPAGLDVCADPSMNQALTTAQDTTIGSYLPAAEGAGGGVILQDPVYRGRTDPVDVKARREALIGWLAVQLNPTLLIDRALQAHPNTAATLRYHDQYSDAEYSSGSAGDDAHSVLIDLHNGWSVKAFQSVQSASVLANTNAVVLLVTGVALSVLIAVLILVLETGRARALRLTGELRHQALHDSLTGLPNRALIMDRIEQLLARTRRHGHSGAALFVDLDDFKNVNDTLGHEAGDRLLVAVTARLATALRDADTIGRMGGDEFVVLLDGSTFQAAPELVAERLLEVMRQPFELDGTTMPLTVNISIGIAIGDRETPGELLRDADVALYEAKGAGKNRYEIFQADMQSDILHRVELEFDIRQALQADQFRLVYQPIYNLEDLSVTGVETLLRWHHPVRGVIQPDDFIPILEQTGHIREVGRWVLNEACAQMAAWHSDDATLSVSVNVSGRQLDHDDIINDVRDALEHSGLNPTTLIIEVTETALMRNTKATARRLDAIKELGVRIAVDDFGTGYSSLAYLRQFPVDCLKIDRMFTNAITTSPESKALIGTFVQLGRDLGLRTLAEGVETTGELDHLRDENVDEAQGFLLSRPLDAEAFETRLLRRTRRSETTTT